MQAFSRSAANAAQTARAFSRQQSRRYAHDAHHDSHGASNIKYPADEKLGSGFYVAISFIPIGFFLYKFAGPGNYEHPYLTRVINSYDGYRKDAARINDLHTKAIERAGADRNLFANLGRNDRVDLKFPEILNTGAPHNVPAGHYTDMTKVIEKYEKEAYAVQAEKLQQIKDNKVPCEQPYPSNRLPTGTETMLM